MATASILITWRRRTAAGSCRASVSSVERSIYLAHEGFGVRLEIDCYVNGNDVEVTTLPLQDAWVLLG